MTLAPLEASAYSLHRQSGRLTCEVAGIPGLREVLEPGLSLRSALTENGAVLIRGARLERRENFEALLLGSSAFMPWSSYPFMERTRQKLGAVTVSSNYTREGTARNGIFDFHQENSFLPRGFSPEWLAFCCVMPAMRGGEAGVINVADALSALPATLQDKLDRSRTRHHVRMAAAEWEESYGTFAKDRLEQAAASHGARVKKATKGHVWLEFDRPYVESHRISGRRGLHYDRRHVWGTVFRSGAYRAAFAPHHVQHLADPVFARLRRPVIDLALKVSGRYRAEHLHLCAAEAEALALAWADHLMAVPYQAGDLLLVDNVLTEHTALPWSGDRRLLVAMGDYHGRNDARS